MKRIAVLAAALIIGLNLSACNSKSTQAVHLSSDAVSSSAVSVSSSSDTSSVQPAESSSSSALAASSKYIKPPAVIPRTTTSVCAASSKTTSRPAGSRSQASRPASSSSRPVPSKPSDNVKAIKVLFIGNSLTFSSNIPFILTDVAESKNKKIVCDSITLPDYTLEMHYKEIAQDYFQTHRYDYVVLQDHGLPPVADPETFYKYVRLF